MFGGSYVGATQMLAAITNPPHLAGICPIVTSSNYHESWTYQGGAFEQWFNQSLDDRPRARHAHSRIDAQLQRRERHVGASARRLPALQHERRATPPQPKRSRPTISTGSRIPTTTTTGKKSPSKNTSPTFTSLLFTSRLGTTSSKAARSRIISASKPTAATTPRATASSSWSSSAATPATAQKSATSCSGPESNINEDDVILEWYDFLFRGAQNRFADGKPVKIFVMGENKWREESEWPLARAKETKYFLHATAAANSIKGKGTLSTSAPAKESADQFTYDPAKPVPTIGGPLCCDADHWPAGPRDQRPAEARDDVLVYSTQPFAQDTEITGPVSVEALRQIICARHRLHRQTRRRLARRLRAKSHRRHHSRQPSRIAGASDADHARRSLQIRDRPLVHEQRLQKGPHVAPRNLEQQFSALRPQPQHRQPASISRSPRKWRRRVHNRNEHDPSRRRPSIVADRIARSSKMRL